MAYQYGSCSPRKAKLETVYVSNGVRIRQIRAGSTLWRVETYEEFAGVWHLVGLKPESYFDALKRAEYTSEAA